MEFNEKLFQALKNDDLNEFRNCMELNPCGSLRLGRFPVLSIMYLYNSRRILHAYEKSFLKHNSWQDIGEPMELSAKFRHVAGKCLRIYLNETVSPVEMLLMLNRDSKLRSVFPKTHMATPAKQRLVEIYYVKWGLHAEIRGETIALERRPLTHREKMWWLTIIACVVLCVAIVVSTPFVVNAFVPFIKDGNGILNLSKWEQIKFDSDKTYALKKDVTVSEDFFQEEMNCNIVGNGHTVTIAGNGLFRNINGSISNVTFVTSGAPIAENINGRVENVTVNAVVDMQVDKATGFFATNNYGTISNVTVNVSGILYAMATEDANSYTCGGIVAINDPTAQGITEDSGLQNCTANYANFVLQGQLAADAAFGGIVGQNNSLVENCKTDGVISADTFDVAGICAENNYWIISGTNNATITQQSDVTGWNPLAAGIVLNNYFVVDQCENNGNISCTSTAAAVANAEEYPCAYASGLVYLNSGTRVYVQNSTNNGTITASAKEVDASAAGVCNFTNSYVSVCVNNGQISATSSHVAEAAGIVNLLWGYTYLDLNNGAISAESSNEAHVGGIVSTSSVQTQECVSFGNISGKAPLCYVGGIVGFAEVYLKNGVLSTAIVTGCIADCEITATGNVTAVGGIVGYVQEMEVSVGGLDYTVGGSVSYCYFVGRLSAIDSGYLGGIVGVAGKSIYVEPATEDTVGNFHDNAYLDVCGASAACGAILEGADYGTPRSDIGAVRAALAVIQSNETYKAILKGFEK